MWAGRAVLTVGLLLLAPLLYQLARVHGTKRGYMMPTPSAQRTVRAPLPPQLPPPLAPPPTAGYTVVLNAFRRDREVVQLVPHWVSCHSVAEVIVVWNDVGRPPPQPILDLVGGCNAGDAPDGQDTRVRLVRPPTNDIQNRWAVPTGGFRTAAVLNVDDDVKISCPAVELAFAQWELRGGTTMVGFEPRVWDYTKIEEGGYVWNAVCCTDALKVTHPNCDKWAKIQRGLARGPDPDRYSDVCGKYNTLWPTRAAFLAAGLYDLYWTAKYRPVRELVTELNNGEDLAMSFVHHVEHVRAGRRGPDAAAPAPPDAGRLYNLSAQPPAKLLPGDVASTGSSMYDSSMHGSSLLALHPGKGWGRRHKVLGCQRAGETGCKCHAPPPGTVKDVKYTALSSEVRTASSKKGSIGTVWVHGEKRTAVKERIATLAVEMLPPDRVVPELMSGFYFVTEDGASGVFDSDPCSHLDELTDNAVLHCTA